MMHAVPEAEPMPASVIEALRQIREEAVSLQEKSDQDLSKLLTLIDSASYLATISRANAILKFIADKRGLQPSQIRLQSRNRDIVQARQEVCYEIRRTLKWSLPRIAAFVGLTDHTTIVHAIRAVEARRSLESAK